MIDGVVADASTTEPLPFATVQIIKGGKAAAQTRADADGRFRIAVSSVGGYSMKVSYIGYETKIEPLSLGKIKQEKNGNTLKINVALKPQTVSIKDVVVTAIEKRSITSTSVINRQAMEHLQPSSFTDLLALLPGGMTKTPDMGSANSIRLREVGIADRNYSITSLGTKFIIDGATVGTDANMQYVPDAAQGESSYYRQHVASGVDMRTIPTDNIESVEIVRGIPSVRYGDLTSGLVRITRKSTASPLEARFKADQYGKLLSVGKGVDFSDRNLSLNADGGFFSSRVDPRNKFENYDRVNLSLRLRKYWLYEGGARLTWNINTDYSGNIDNVKTDPEVQIHTEDSYKSSYHEFGLTNTLTFRNKTGALLRRVELVSALSLSLDKLKQRRFVSLDRAYAVPLSYQDGAYDGYFLPYTYVADYVVDGKPFYSNTRLEAELGFRTGPLRHRITAGGEWQLNKNYGAGQQYDIKRPYYEGSSRRPRAFRDIPATDIVSLYFEDYATLSLGRHELSLMAGVRSQSMLNVGRQFTVHGMTTFDPRVNVEWTLPEVKGLSVSLSGGVGRMSKSPTILDLYPDKLYMDLTQLNYWNENPEYRRINIRTYVIDRNNYNLKSAYNLKWEGRVTAAYKGHNLSVTYFHERTSGGFRTMRQVRPFVFTKYDASAVNGSTLTAPPRLEDLPSVPDTVLRGYELTGNGSTIIKQGVEFQYSSPRLSGLNTRFTVNGAWFRTVYENSRPEFYNGITQTVNGIRVNDKYVGLYDWKDAYVKSQMTSNIIIDTYVDRLGLIFSATAECFLFGKEWSPWQDRRPVAYMDTKGEMHEYTSSSEKDLYLQWLNMNVKNSSTPVSRNRFYMCMNFKLSKRFGKSLVLSFFADRIINYAPDYELNGFIVRRSFTPYFGMELNISI